MKIEAESVEEEKIDADNGENTATEDNHFVRMRGLPYSATTDEVYDFFTDIEIAGGKDGIHMTLARDGRPSGEAYVEFVSDAELQKALKKHKENMGSRYIEVFKSEGSEMEWIKRRMAGGGTDTSSELEEEEGDAHLVRMRGLPYSTTMENITKFFCESKIAGEKEGIHMTFSSDGRPSGEAFVELESEEDVEKALLKHKEYLGHRYIEVHKAKGSEMKWVKENRRWWMDGVGGPGDEGIVQLRGLPFGSSKEDISQFFSGLEIATNGITLSFDHQGRSSGEAFVQFVDKKSADEAMKKQKERIGHRYIEIFNSSSRPKKKKRKRKRSGSS